MIPTAREGGPDDVPVPGGHMVVCGDDALAYRLTVELASLYGRRVTVVLPSLERGHGPRLAALEADGRWSVTVREAPVLDDAALEAAGVREAVALALTSGDDQVNIHAALRARRLNPTVRLAVRVFNRRLGVRVEQLLDRAALARDPGLSAAALEASTTVLSASATAAPAMVAAAVSGRSHVLQVDGRLLRLAETAAGAEPLPGQIAVLAVPGTGPGAGDPPDLLLPDPAAVPPGGARLVLELLGSDQPPRRPRRLPGLAGLPLGSLFASRLRWALGALGALVLLFAGLTWWVTGSSPQYAAWLALLDVLGIADPAEGAVRGRKMLQVLSAISGMLLMPLLIAVALEVLGTFRTYSVLRRPPRRLEDHTVLVGLGRVGSRVLERLWEMDVPVVCVEKDPSALGVAQARAYGVPVVIGDATQDGVLEAARITRAQALVCLTSDDSTNVEAALYARECHPDIRAVLRLFDDDFANDVYRALKDSYPSAVTRSRSVSFLAAPSFASAMMGRQVIGAVAVGREVVLVVAVDVAANAHLDGRTVEQAHRPGAWHILAVDLAEPADRTPDLAHSDSTATELLWNPPPNRLLVRGDLVVLAATREGLGRLLTPQPLGHPGTPQSAQGA
ncbi:NAD-binding protein [Kitasatospora sp. NBC_00070]|uniref:NAD-binding protein n=1 Tax=Kitasatospora sp. NBC_00070 TaxID=2975962 RepID=UPI003243C978